VIRSTAILAVVLSTFATSPALAQSSRAALKPVLQGIVDRYLETRSKAEHISAVSVSVSFPGEPQNLNVVAGRTALDPRSASIAPTNLFQIGSITKSFTAAAVLQLEAEGKLSIDQTVGRWLPQYPAWRGVTIRRLLDMTSGILGYDNVPAMGKALAQHGLHRRFSDSVLVGFVDPAYPAAPAPTHGWNYSNTNYILAGMIIERASGNSYGSEIARRFLGPKYDLETTYYSPNVYPASVLQRQVSGYFWNTDPGNEPLRPLLGVDLRDMDMSWAGAAGAVVSRPEDVTHWARALYQGDMLAPKQRRELETLVSDRTGKPLTTTSVRHPVAFGLGVGQLTKPGFGTFWYYQGETLGYRMLYIYSEKRDLAIAVGLNSQPSDAQNKNGELIEQLYKAIVK
jgi:D-alanyl-D-alanine carboxypeptidase